MGRQLVDTPTIFLCRQPGDIPVPVDSSPQARPVDNPTPEVLQHDQQQSSQVHPPRVEHCDIPKIASLIQKRHVLHSLPRQVAFHTLSTCSRSVWTQSTVLYKHASLQACKSFLLRTRSVYRRIAHFTHTIPPPKCRLTPAGSYMSAFTRLLLASNHFPRPKPCSREQQAKKEDTNLISLSAIICLTHVWT